MKIENVDDVNIITLIHKGNNAKFQCIPQPMSYMPRIDLMEDRKAEIVFNDLREVDELITMLERFKKECSGYLGGWHRL